jgi:pimeloyl-ACP methyl ester carboxylesterase
MEKHVDLGGLRTWYAEYGDGPPLVLLHPGGVGVDSRTFAPNVGALADRFRVYTPDRRAHGRTPDTDAPLSYEAMAEDTAAFLRTVVGGPASVLGCSDGAVVALLTALRYPDLVDRLVFVAGVFHRDGWLPGVLDGDGDDPPEFLATSYAEVSPDGPEHAPIVARKLARMHAEGPSLTVDELAKVTARTLVMIGDDDEVAFEHAVALYRALPTGEFAVVPGTSHGLLVEKAELCNRLVLDFLTTAPVRTFAPIRRR